MPAGTSMRRPFHGPTTPVRGWKRISTQRRPSRPWRCSITSPIQPSRGRRADDAGDHRRRHHRSDRTGRGDHRVSALGERGGERRPRGLAAVVLRRRLVLRHVRVDLVAELVQRDHVARAEQLDDADAAAADVAAWPAASAAPSSRRARPARRWRRAHGPSAGRRRTASGRARRGCRPPAARCAGRCRRSAAPRAGRGPLRSGSATSSTMSTSASSGLPDAASNTMPACTSRADLARRPVELVEVDAAVRTFAAEAADAVEQCFAATAVDLDDADRLAFLGAQRQHQRHAAAGRCRRRRRPHGRWHRSPTAFTPDRREHHQVQLDRHAGMRQRHAHAAGREEDLGVAVVAAPRRQRALVDRVGQPQLLARLQRPRTRSRGGPRDRRPCRPASGPRRSRRSCRRRARLRTQTLNSSASLLPPISCDHDDARRREGAAPAVARRPGGLMTSRAISRPVGLERTCDLRHRRTAPGAARPHAPPRRSGSPRRARAGAPRRCRRGRAPADRRRWSSWSTRDIVSWRCSGTMRKPGRTHLGDVVARLQAAEVVAQAAAVVAAVSRHCRCRHHRAGRGRPRRRSSASRSAR